MKRSATLISSFAAVCLAPAAVTEAACPAEYNPTHFVTFSGAGAGDCSDWANACTLATALSPTDPDRANSGDVVFVEAGTYTGSITLVNGVRIIGGFAGTETDACTSDPAVNETILDGEGVGPVVLSTNDAASTMLRGFTITGGHQPTLPGNAGGNEGGGGARLTNSSAMFVQCVFELNSAVAWGGAVVVKGTGAAEFVNCRFKNNGAVNFGSGAVTPYAGGAVFITGSSPRFTNCLFANNTGMEAGAIAVDSGAPTFINCTVSGNSSTLSYGGGIYDPLGLATIKNSIFWNNTAIRGNAEVECYTGRFSEITKSDIGGGYVGTGNIDADPLLTQGFKLNQTSPCKNKGQSFALPPDVADLDWDGNTGEKVPLDLNGDPRKVEFIVDMGAYETPLDPGPQ